MPLMGFEPTIPASERPQTHALDRAATGIGFTLNIVAINTVNYIQIITHLDDVTECW
jgi:hypothetical protein